MTRKKRNTSIDDRVDLNKSDVPYSVLYGNSHIEMFGNTKITFEGKYTILEYTTELLKIKLNKQTICIIGSELTLNNVENGGFLLTGKVGSIEFE